MHGVLAAIERKNSLIRWGVEVVMGVWVMGLGGCCGGGHGKRGRKGRLVCGWPATIKRNLTPAIMLTASTRTLNHQPLPLPPPLYLK